MDSTPTKSSPTNVTAPRIKMLEEALDKANSVVNLAVAKIAEQKKTITSLRQQLRQAKNKRKRK